MPENTSWHVSKKFSRLFLIEPTCSDEEDASRHFNSRLSPSQKKLWITYRSSSTLHSPVALLSSRPVPSHDGSLLVPLSHQWWPSAGLWCSGRSTSLAAPDGPPLRQGRNRCGSITQTNGFFLIERRRNTSNSNTTAGHSCRCSAHRCLSHTGTKARQSKILWFLWKCHVLSMSLFH